MTNNIDMNINCLTDDDLYSYLTNPKVASRLPGMEAHLAGCPGCRQALADLLELLHPEKGVLGEEIPAFTDAQLQDTLNLIKSVSRDKRTKKAAIPPWLRWGMAACVAVGLVTITVLVIMLYSEKRSAQAFFNRAAEEISQSYTGTSPNNLRLFLPFSAKSINRSAGRRDTFRSAENHLSQALAIRENMVEAHLGLGFIYLSGSEFGGARAEFEKILTNDKGDRRALIGRGVVSFEEALQAPDALLRIHSLRNALSDFDAALKLDPNSVEARYDKIQTLYELGEHQQALKEIDLYLQRDSKSAWSQKLRDLKTKLQLIRSSAFKTRLDLAARARDRDQLSELCRLLPHQVPSAIVSLLKRSLQQEQNPAPVKNGTPSSEDLVWAAKILEAGYSGITGDHSLTAVINFYVGLSPPERLLKNALDSEFKRLATYYLDGKYNLLFSRSISLEKRYTRINDRLQLFDLYHLRGNSFYLDKADFKAAETEYLKMYRIADQFGTPEFLLKSLSALAIIWGQQGKHDRSVNASLHIRSLAQKHDMDYWKIYAAMNLGDQYRKLGQSEQALREYSLALTFASRLSDSMKIAEGLENSLIVMGQEGRFLDAKELYMLAIHKQDAFLNNPADSDKARVVVRRVNLLLRKGDLSLRFGEIAEAQNIFRECLASIQDGMAELETRTRLGLAETYLQTKHIQEAEIQIDRALTASKRGHYWDSIWKAKFLKGRALELSGHPDNALAYYEQSLTALEQMRHDVRTRELKQTFFNNRYDPFKAIIALLLKSGTKVRALEFVDRAKAAALKEDMASTSRPHLAGEKAVNEDPTVEYFFSNDGLLIFFSGSGRVEVSFSKISSAELGRQVAKFINSTASGDSEEFDGLARSLYRELIGPVEKHVWEQDARTLVILPDGPLHLLPFAGLMDERDRFLIEKIPISYAPSRSVLRYCQSASPFMQGRENTRVLLIDGTRGLPHAQDELAFIAKLYGTSARTGINELQNMEHLVRKFEIVHFATHALIEQDKPVLILQGDSKEIHLDSGMFRGWDFSNAQLVNLAGCSTGIGPIAEGEAPWGLIPAFLNAGAHSIVASLLPVDDESTQKLNCLFYEFLKKGETKAKALQLAQHSLLHAARNNPRGTPRSWIPYILIGSPR